jgi:hypothetical protein
VLNFVISGFWNPLFVNLCPTRNKIREFLITFCYCLKYTGNFENLTHFWHNTVFSTWNRVIINLNAIFNNIQLYRSGQFYWWRKPEYPEKTTDLSQVTDSFIGVGNQNTWRKTLTCCKSLTNFIWFVFTILVVIGTDCTGSWKLPYDHDI